ncbi:hypothetical protein Taro_042220 [Colocasia esculenta]|uniref:DUF4283 domain-containing protein n=1 Tax=Colocasia esculenta TaxID=4460 RepID=A0A843X253_COLES|nr:hypothetical protein [Colocasia esculenta]
MSYRIVTTVKSLRFPKKSLRKFGHQETSFLSPYEKTLFEAFPNLLRERRIPVVQRLGWASSSAFDILECTGNTISFGRYCFRRSESNKNGEPAGRKIRSLPLRGCKTPEPGEEVALEALENKIVQVMIGLRTPITNIYLKGFLFRFFRWANDFDFSADPTLIPIWVGFPNLPVNLYNEDYLKCIAGNFWEILRIHDSTLAWTQTAEALVCVDVDIAKPLPDRIWIGQGEKGFWKPVRFHRVPPICNLCRKLGHTQDVCKRKIKESAQSHPPQQPSIAPLAANGKKIDQEWHVVHRKGEASKHDSSKLLNLPIPVSNAFERLASNFGLNDEPDVGLNETDEPVVGRNETVRASSSISFDPSIVDMMATIPVPVDDVHGTGIVHACSLVVKPIWSPGGIVVLPEVLSADNMSVTSTTVTTSTVFGKESAVLGNNNT